LANGNHGRSCGHNTLNTSHNDHAGWFHFSQCTSYHGLMTSGAFRRTGQYGGVYVRIVALVSESNYVQVLHGPPSTPKAKLQPEILKTNAQNKYNFYLLCSSLHFCPSTLRPISPQASSAKSGVRYLLFTGIGTPSPRYKPCPNNGPIAPAMSTDVVA
jgi:hypothetical protein